MPYNSWADHGGMHERRTIRRYCLPSLLFLLLSFLLFQLPAVSGSASPRYQPRRQQQQQQQQQQLLEQRRPPVRLQHHHVASIVRRGMDYRGDSGVSRPEQVLRRLKYEVSEGWRRWKQEHKWAAMAEGPWKPDVTKQQQQEIPNLEAWRPDDGTGQHKSADWLLFEKQSRAAAAFVAQEMMGFPQLLEEKHEAYGCMSMCCADLLQINIWNRLQHGDEYKVLQLPQAWHICATEGRCKIDKLVLDNAALVFRRLEEEKEASSLPRHRQRQGQLPQPTPDPDVPPAAAAFSATSGHATDTATAIEGRGKDVDVDGASISSLRLQSHREKLVAGGDAYNRYDSGSREAGPRRRSSPLFAWPSSSLTSPFLSLANPLSPSPPPASSASTSASASLYPSSSSPSQGGTILHGLRERYRSIRSIGSGSSGGMQALWKAVSASSPLSKPSSSLLSSSSTSSSSSSSAHGAPTRGFQRPSYRFMLVDGKKYGLI